MGMEVAHPEPMKRTRRLELVSLSVILALGLAPKLSFADEAQANTNPVNVVMTETDSTENGSLTDNTNQTLEVPDDAQDSGEETTEPLPDESNTPESPNQPEVTEQPNEATDPGNSVTNNENNSEIPPVETPSGSEINAAIPPSEEFEIAIGLDGGLDEDTICCTGITENEDEEVIDSLNALFSEEASYAASAAGYTWPLPSAGRITQNYSNSHSGTDIAIGAGTKVMSAMDGKVKYVQKWDGHSKTNMQSYGNLVIVYHPSTGTATYYAHLKSISVSLGQTVKQGQQIGTVGSTGNSTGNHLHFEMHLNAKSGNNTYGKSDGTRTNPLNYVGPNNLFDIHVHSYQANGYTFVDYAGHNKNTRCSCGLTQSTYEGHTWKTTTDDKQRVCSVCGHEAVGFNGYVTTAKEGEYWVEAAGNNTFRIDVSAGAVNTEKTNVQLWSKHDVAAQKITIKKSPYADGTYLLQVGTAPMLIGAAEDYNLKAGVNVCLRKNSVSNESNRWFIEVNSDGTYSFRNKCNNLYMDIWGAVFADGTNVQCWGGNQGSAQKFNLVAVPAPEPEPKPEPDPEPVTPVEPSTPDNPSTPTTPDKPSTPTTPENPSTPSQPTKPSTPTPSPSTKSGSWQESTGSWWYCYSDGSYPKSQWLKIGPTWYHFDKSGWMQTGWYSEGKHWYYLGTNGAMKTGWYGVGPTWYYSNASGVMQTGWIKDGNNWYYLGSDGAMRTGWFAVNSTWYYSNASGVMQANKWIGNYYVTSSGAMATDTWVGKYHVNSNGVWDDER